MSPFRFQLTAVTAVFGSLAVGLAVGTAVLPGPGSATADARDTALLAQLGADVTAREQFAEALAPAVLDSRLTGVRVLLVSTPGGESDVDGVAAMLRVAGVSVTTRVDLTARFTDPGSDAELRDLALRARPPSVTGGPPTAVDGVGASTALLAAVLLARTPAVTATDLAGVLAAYTSQGYLSVSAAPGPADAVVLVTGAPVAGPDATLRNAAVRTIAGQLDLAGPLVVAGDTAAGDGNAVALIRADPRLAASVSTVDNASTPPGRLVTAWALADQLAGRCGHYGTGAGAALIPSARR